MVNSTNVSKGSSYSITVKGLKGFGKLFLRINFSGEKLLLICKNVHIISGSNCSTNNGGSNCYNQSVDSVTASIAAGDSITCGVLAWTSGVGSDYIQIKIVELFNISNNISVNINFLAQYDLKIDNEYPNANNIKILSCFPNPFNPSILLEYKVVKRNHVRLDVYNILGKKVKSLVEEVHENGNHYTKWDGNNGFNKPVPSGAYFLSMQSGEYLIIKKITLIK